MSGLSRDRKILDSIPAAHTSDSSQATRPQRVPNAPHEKALAHIREQSGTHFDPDVVAAFLGLEEVAPRLAS